MVHINNWSERIIVFNRYRKIVAREPREQQRNSEQDLESQDLRQMFRCDFSHSKWGKEPWRKVPHFSCLELFCAFLYRLKKISCRPEYGKSCNSNQNL